MNIQRTACNKFGLGLYDQLRHRSGNLLFSPFSIETAFAMTYAGARGKTATQIANVFGFELDQNRFHPEYADLISLVRTIGETGDIQLETANALWPQDGYDFLGTFLDLMKQEYGSKITPLDFQNTDEARKRINTWTADTTNNLIKELIPKGILNNLTRLVLTNAIHFKGDWMTPFDPKDTFEAPFWVNTDESVPVQMMKMKGKFGYLETEFAQILEMDYAGGRLSTVIILPKTLDGLSTIEASLSSKRLRRWLDFRWKQEVVVTLPRFKFRGVYRLDEILEGMGMTDAFNPNQADFSGMDGRVNWLYISAVLHNAVIEVNEEGSEAAAATAVVIAARSLPPKPFTFQADHPFIFLIRDKVSGCILFLGRFAKP